MLLFTSSLAISHALLTGQRPGAEVRNSCIVGYCQADSNFLSCLAAHLMHTLLEPAAVVVCWLARLKAFQSETVPPGFQCNTRLLQRKK